jgi:arylsulfatase A-like enzyme
MAIVAWSAVWGPHDARIAGWHRVGWAPPIVMGVVAPYWPGGVLAMGVAGGVAGALLRDRGDPKGQVALQRKPPARTTRPDILLITVDTVRADAGMLDEGKWTARSPFSPTQGWTHFSEAIAPAPWTLPSMHSLFTSLPVRRHGGGLPAPTGHTSRTGGAIGFPFALQQAGYETVAVVSNPHLSPESGFADGFDRWIHSDDAHEPLVLMHQWTRWKERWTGEVTELRHRRDRGIVDRAVAELSRPATRPRFVWVHLLSPHEYARDPAVAVPDWKPGTQDQAVLQAAYAANIQSVRSQVVRMSTAANHWVVAVTSDHGEAFGEGGHWGHGKALHDPELHVPLAIRRPGVEGGVVKRPVATADLGHTLLAFAGAAKGFPGRNLHGKARRRVQVGGVRLDGGAFAVRTPQGHYLPAESGLVGRTVRLRDSTQEAIRALGYTD